MARKYVTCPQGHRNDRTGGRRKCSFPGCGATLPKRRVPKHAETLRDDNYGKYSLLALDIHGGEPDACGVCGKPKPESRRHDRDHDHRTCTRCNKELLRNATLEETRAVVAYLERVEQFYAKTVA